MIRNFTIGLFALFVSSNLSLQAAPSQADIDRLGKDLTPYGAEKAGNAEGTIPDWQGGITEPPAGYRRGDHHPDPFSEDQPMFTITAQNMAEYADHLTEGHKALLKTYGKSFKLPVYPTRRSAAAPQRIYDATRQVAATARLTDDKNGVRGTVIGTPFPIPSEGVELVWNHILRWRGEAAERWVDQAVPTRGGSYTTVKFNDEFLFQYVLPGMTEDKLDNVILYFLQQTIAPARLAGGILLAHETLDQSKENRRAWLYNPGQRRVRRAPNVAFDNPGTASDSQRTNDQFDLFNGSPEKYNWKLVGKKEVYIPYNSYKLHSDKLKNEDILTPLHINQDLTRYELHRVWVVDGTLKDGERHIYKRRTLYIDEDSWQIAVADLYDNRDQMWRVSEGHAINYYEVPAFWYTLEVHTDLQNGRYLAIGLDNENEMYDFSIKRSPQDYTPSALRRKGKR